LENIMAKACATAAAFLMLEMMMLAPEAIRALAIPSLDMAGIEQASVRKGQVITEEKVFWGEGDTCDLARSLKRVLSGQASVKPSTSC
jgi:hypothetical protein